MLVDEFLPMLSRRGLDTERVGLLGWSMGGYGVLAGGFEAGGHAMGYWRRMAPGRLSHLGRALSAG